MEGSQGNRARPSLGSVSQNEPKISNSTQRGTPDPEALFETHLRPLLERYAAYDTPAERAYAERRLRAKLDRMVADAVKSRDGASARFHSELRCLVNEQLERAAEIERRNLVDEAHWRRDERKRAAEAAKNLGEAAMTRKRNEEALRKEEMAEAAWKMKNLRREERAYANRARKGEEEEAFARILAEVRGN